jgi:two-component sensor histidine kinase
VREPYHDESGFGSLLLSKIAGPDLKGETKLVFDSEGVVWTADFPIWQKETPEEEAR